MFNNSRITVKNGHLHIGDADCVQLAAQYGTPLYVMDEQTIRENCRLFTGSLNTLYERSLVLFASKAFSCLEMYRLADSEGMGVDVVSGGELYCALKAGFPAQRIFFHGNNKTTDELTLALDSGVGRIIVDNTEELCELAQLAEQRSLVADIMLRIKPGIDAHTHDFIKTGQIDSKFGFALENGEAFAAIKQASALDSIRLCGLHCHIGSQIFDDKPFIEAARVMLELYLKIKRQLGLELEDLNLGGGFGIKYIEQDSPMAYDSYMVKASQLVHEFCSSNGLSVPRIIIEPGRAIVGAAGTTLYTVGSVKQIENVRNYVAIDGGMSDNPRYALYGAQYCAVVANRADEKADYTATIAGKCCESGDLIAENVQIAKPEKGDTLAVLSTGAYCYSMASNYNRMPKAAVAMVNGDKSRLIIRRESYEDLIRNEI